MESAKIILGWIFLWLTGWYLWLFLFKKGLNYIKTYRLSALYFFVLSTISSFLYRNHLTNFLFKIPIRLFPLILIPIFYILLFGIYYFSQKIFDKKILRSHFNKNILVAMMNYNYIFSKSFDILFHQLLFLCLVLSLGNIISNNSLVIFTSAFAFGLVHLPLLFIKYNRLAIYYVPASFLAGLIFSSLIIIFPYGFVYSYMIHWNFYVLVGLIYNIRIRKNLFYQ